MNTKLTPCVVCEKSPYMTNGTLAQGEWLHVPGRRLTGFVCDDCLDTMIQHKRFSYAPTE